MIDLAPRSRVQTEKCYAVGKRDWWPSWRAAAQPVVAPSRAECIDATSQCAGCVALIDLGVWSAAPHKGPWRCVEPCVELAQARREAVRPIIFACETRALMAHAVIGECVWTVAWSVRRPVAH